MNKNNTSIADGTIDRLKMKTHLQHLKIISEKGADLSGWEAQILTDIVKETFFRTALIVRNITSGRKDTSDRRYLAAAGSQGTQTI